MQVENVPRSQGQERLKTMRRSVSDDNVQQVGRRSRDENHSLRQELQLARVRIAELQHGQQAIFNVLDAVASRLDAQMSQACWSEHASGTNIKSEDTAILPQRPEKALLDDDSQVITLNFPFA